MPPETLADLLDALEGHIATLERYARDVPVEALESSEDEQNKVLFAIHKTVQTAIDAANFLIAERALGPATTYRAVFDKLCDAGLLDRELGDRMAGWAGLRNVIVHIYRGLDLQKIHHAYAAETADLREFIRVLRKFASQ